MEHIYIQKLRDRLREQEAVYKAVCEGKCDTVCYKGYEDEEWGQNDANYTNRMRLAYYLLYESIDNEKVVAYLFGEELEDRETNDFQGIGNTLRVLTTLLQSYNVAGKYAELFTRAKEANFDCACGYDADDKVNVDIFSNDLWDAIHLAKDLEYKDIMSELVDGWKQSITSWTDSDKQNLVHYNTYLGREEENGRFYQEFVDKALLSGDTFHKVSAYKDFMCHYIKVHKYEEAYKVFGDLRQNCNLDEVRHIRLFDMVLEGCLELISNYPEKGQELWQWAKPCLKSKKPINMFGNLYEKAIDAAKRVKDSYAEQLEKEYAAWKKMVGLK